MANMWQHIRQGVRWRPKERYGLAVRALNLTKVKSVKISLDPFYKDTLAVREFWKTLSTPKVRATNPQVEITYDIRTDGKPPYFDAELIDNQRIIFETSGLHISDVIITMNRMLGNPDFGRAGNKANG